MTDTHHDIKAVFFDFSGVLAEEGFVNGLQAIAERNGFDTEAFLTTAMDICYKSGYVTGEATEEEFWEAVRKQTGLIAPTEVLHLEILTGFSVRLWMLDVVDIIRASGIKTAILSDHTNWLENVDFEHAVYSHFDWVFNSYREGITKRQHAYFHKACESLGVKPEEALFIDDNPSNILRADEIGMQTIHYDDHDRVLSRLQELFPKLSFPTR